MTNDDTLSNANFELQARLLRQYRKTETHRVTGGVQNPEVDKVLLVKVREDLVAPVHRLFLVIGCGFVRLLLFVFLLVFVLIIFLLLVVIAVLLKNKCLRSFIGTHMYLL